MSLTLTYPTLSDTATKTELETNFTDTANKFGNIDNTDIKAGAAIDVDKLSGQYEHMVVRLMCRTFSDGGAVNITPLVAANGVPTAAQITLTACGAEAVLDVFPIPGDSSDSNWSIYDVSWACSDTGNGAAKVRVDWGYLNATGVWTLSNNVVSAFTLSNANAAQDQNDGHAVNSTATTLDFNHANGGNTPRELRLILDTVGAGVMSQIGDYLVVTLYLRRKISAS